MGFRFRKSVNMGPLRVNFSKSGVGYSVGGKGFRFTKKANGGFRTTTSVPGTGVSYTKDFGGGSGHSSGSSSPDASGNPTPKQPRDKKPWYRRWWVYLIAALLVIGLVAGGGDKDNDTNADGSALTETVDEKNTVESTDSSPQETTQDPVDTSPEDATAEQDQPEAPAEQSTQPEESTEAVAPVTTPTEETTTSPAEEPATQPEEQPATQPEQTPEPVEEPEASEAMVWVTETGKKYHNKPDCGNTKNATQVPLSKAQGMGLEPCARCY